MTGSGMGMEARAIAATTAGAAAGCSGPRPETIWPAHHPCRLELATGPSQSIPPPELEPSPEPLPVDPAVTVGSPLGAM
jgi:hypothetical protein